MQTEMTSRGLSQHTCFTIITGDLYSARSTQVRRQFDPLGVSSLTNCSAELSLPDLSKLIGDEWKKLSENQKAVSFRYRDASKSI